MKRQRTTEQISQTGKINLQSINRKPKSRTHLPQPADMKSRLIAVIIILIVTFVSYYPALDNELTNWDDKQYVVENPHLKSFSGETIKAIFSEKSYMGNYHPLTMLSLNVDYAIGGELEDGSINPYPFHLINIILHLIVTLLVFQFAYKLSGRILVAFIAALLFGTHTLHVESVAWVSERKDVLYSIFFVGGLSAYLNYVDTKKTRHYIAALILFILSLLSKGQAVSLAVTLVAIDYFRDRKYFSVRILVEKIPFLLLALGFGIFAVMAQGEGDAIADEEQYELHKRIGFAAYAYMQYLLKLMLPLDLTAMYPYPDIVTKKIPPHYYLGLIPAAISIWAIFKTYKTNKAVTFSIAFFIINIFLLLQFIPVGSAVHADRYAYIPSIGFYLLIGFGAQYFVEIKPKKQSVLYGIIGMYALVLAALTFQRCDIWQDSMSLWNDTIKKQPKAVTAWNNRGSELDRMAKAAMDRNDNATAITLRQKAIQDFTAAINGKPDYSNAMYNRGSSAYEIAKVTRDTILLKNALTDLTNAIKYNQRFAEAYHHRGNTTAELADYRTNPQKQNLMWEAAVKDMNIAIELKQTDGNFYVNRGVTKGKLGKLDEAVTDFDTALQLSGESETIYSNRGLAKARKAANYQNSQSVETEKGKKYIHYPEITDINERKKFANENYSQAISDYNAALKLKPDFLTGYYNRAIAFLNSENPNAAISDLDFVLKKDANFTDAWFMRAQAYMKMGNTKQSCMDFAKARDLKHPYAQAYLDAYCK